MTRPGWLRFAPAVVAAGFATFAVWRSTLGFDFRDGTYAVELSVRLAQGDVVFRDEASPHALGAAVAAPFLNAWLHLVGPTGIVLAARLLFVALAVAVAVASWRYLRDVFGSWSAMIGVITAVFVLPYNVFAISYNTIPALGLLLGSSALVSWARRPSRATAVVLAGATTTSALAFPSTAPAALVLFGGAIWLGVRHSSSPAKHCVRVLVLVATVEVTVIFGALLIRPGPAAVWDAARSFVAFRSEAQATLGFTKSVLTYWVMVAGSRPMAVAIAASAVACGLALPRLLRVGAVAIVPIAVGIWASRPGLVGAAEPSSGAYSGVVASWLIVLLGPPVFLHLRSRCERPVQAAVAVIGLTGVVGAWGIVNTTASFPTHGAPAAALTGVLAITGSGAARLLADGAGHWGELLSIAAPLAMCGALMAVVFSEGSGWGLDTRAGAGPTAGLTMSSAAARQVDDLTRSLASCPRLTDGVLSIGEPGVYLLAPARVMSNAVWGVDDGTEAWRWNDRRGTAPGCVLVRERRLASASAYVQEKLAHYSTTARIPQVDDEGQSDAILVLTRVSAS